LSLCPLGASGPPGLRCNSPPPTSTSEPTDVTVVPTPGRYLSAPRSGESPRRQHAPRAPADGITIVMEPINTRDTFQASL